MTDYTIKILLGETVPRNSATKKQKCQETKPENSGNIISESKLQPTFKYDKKNTDNEDDLRYGRKKILTYAVPTNYLEDRSCFNIETSQEVMTYTRMALTILKIMHASTKIFQPL